MMDVLEIKPMTDKELKAAISTGDFIGDWAKQFDNREYDAVEIMSRHDDVAMDNAEWWADRASTAATEKDSQRAVRQAKYWIRQASILIDIYEKKTAEKL